MLLGKQFYKSGSLVVNDRLGIFAYESVGNLLFAFSQSVGRSKYYNQSEVGRRDLIGRLVLRGKFLESLVFLFHLLECRPREKTHRKGF